MNFADIRKSGIALSLLAVVLLGASVAGVDRRLLEPKVNRVSLSASYRLASEGSLQAGWALDGRLPNSFESQYIIEETIPFVKKTTQADPAAVADGDDASSGDGPVLIKVSGIMKTKDDDYQAIVNNNLVRAGSPVYGFKVIEVTENSISIDVDGNIRTLKQGEELKVDPSASRSLELEDISTRNGVWVALINGNYYRSGDEIDKHTQIRAVTPSKVMIARDGKMIILSVDRK